MNQNNLRDFLSTVQNKKYAGVTSFDIIQFAIEKELVERTTVGNFQLTTKGTDFLDEKISWNDVLSATKSDL